MKYESGNETKKRQEREFIGKLNKLHEKLEGQCKYNKFGFQGISKSDKSNIVICLREFLKEHIVNVAFKFRFRHLTKFIR